MECLKESRMDRHNELRTEHRLLYRWPIWFTDEPTGALMQDQMVDITSKAVAFTCYAYEIRLFPNQQIMTQFSIPLCGLDGSFAIRNFTRASYAHRIDPFNKVLHRVTIQLIEPLPFRPGKQTCSESDMITLLRMLASPKR